VWFDNKMQGMRCGNHRVVKHLQRMWGGGAKIMHPKRARPRKKREFFAVARPIALAAAVIGLFSLLVP
jgi:hypothetical protein